MQTRLLTPEGPKVSEIGFDGWGVENSSAEPTQETAEATIHAAIDCGINLFDTSNEDGNGSVNQAIAAALAIRTEKVCVVTQTPPADGPWPPSPYCRWQDRYSAAYLREKVHHQLQDLNRDHIDLLQLQTWTAAWNDDPQPLLVLRQLKEQGKIGMIGVTAPEHDQSCVIQLMRDGLIDVVQIVFNLFQQEAAAQILPVAQETGTGVLVRAALDRNSLTEMFEADTSFAEGNVHHNFFQGDRKDRTTRRVAEIRRDLEQFGIDEQYTLSEVALKFVLARPEIGSVMIGMQSAQQVEQHCRAPARRDLSPEFLQHLRRHDWRRGVWTLGK